MAVAAIVTDDDDVVVVVVRPSSPVIVTVMRQLQLSPLVMIVMDVSMLGGGTHFCTKGCLREFYSKLSSLYDIESVCTFYV